MKKVVLVLDNIRSTHNVGSAFRTADAAGVAHLYLCGTTPAPVDRFDREQKDIAKVALGAEKTIPWTYIKTTSEAVADLKEKGFFVLAIEQDARAVDYKEASDKVSAEKSLAIIFGNEVEGVSKDILDQCDFIAQIQMRGKKESLNISVALGIALFRILDL